MGHIVVDTDSMDPIIANYFRTHFSPSPPSRPANVPTTLAEKPQRRVSPSRFSTSQNADARGRPAARFGSHRKAAKMLIFKSSSEMEHHSATSSQSAPSSPQTQRTSTSTESFPRLRLSGRSSPSQQYSLLPPTEAPNRPLPPSPPQLPFPGPAAWQKQYAGIYGLSGSASKSAFSASTVSLVPSIDENEDEDEGYEGSEDGEESDDVREQLLYQDLTFPSPPSSVCTPAMPLTPNKPVTDDYFSSALAGDLVQATPSEPELVIPAPFMEKAKVALMARTVAFKRLNSQSPSRSRDSKKGE